MTKDHPDDLRYAVLWISPSGLTTAGLDSRDRFSPDPDEWRYMSYPEALHLVNVVMERRFWAGWAEISAPKRKRRK